MYLKKTLFRIETITLSVNTEHSVYISNMINDNTLIVNTYYIIMLVVGKIYLNCF